MCGKGPESGVAELHGDVCEPVAEGEYLARRHIRHSKTRNDYKEK